MQSEVPDDFVSKARMMGRPLVSIIVPTRNSAVHLEAALTSIRGQRYSPIEIIVVDNGSTDETSVIARRLADVFITAGPERCAQCNAGARAARGEYLYRVDSDFVLQAGVVGAAVAACERGADVVQVHNDSDPSVGFWAKVRHFERLMYRNDTVHVGARFFRRTAFEAVGGFDEALIAGEDYDLHNRLVKANYNVAAIEPSETHLGEPTSLWEIVRKSFFYGRSMRRFLQRNGSRGVVQMSPFRGTYLRHWRSFGKQPVISAAFLTMQVVKYVAGAAGLILDSFLMQTRTHAEAPYHPKRAE